MVKTVLIPLPSRDFDPTEVSVPWQILRHAGHEVVFASPNGETASADPIMVTGKGLGPFRLSLRAGRVGRAAYRDLLESGSLAKPLAYSALSATRFDAVVLPGGHAPGMKEYLESETLHRLVSDAFRENLPVGAICHGAVLACRSRNFSSDRSVLHGRKTTGLPEWMELLAWNLTRLWMGNYYRTYPQTVQSEVTAALEDPSDFIRGPISLAKDSGTQLENGFVVQDGNYLSARWPGDAHLFAHRFLRMLDGQG